ncbi:hypothetical protein BJ742DRAFT_36735 [Cladochytrium replicatum]|nr:hypothetical protein BJ742DRAFT_36735 [Cladochytrium replicatum]
MGRSIPFVFLKPSPSPYAPVLYAQRMLVERMPRRECVLFLEHIPTYTAGRRVRGDPDGLAERAKALGAEYYEIQRGGQVTFHGPGQLVGYPIINLKEQGISVRDYVRKLQHLLIAAIQNFDIKSHTGACNETGVWVEDRKVAAIGVHVSRYITSHGFALNCNPDLSWYNHIIPCGITDKSVTSLTVERQRSDPRAPPITTHDSLPHVIEAFSDTFNVNLVNGNDEHDELSSFLEQTMASQPK